MEYFHISAKNIFIFPEKKILPQRLFYFRIEYFHIAWGGAKSLEKYIFCGRKYSLRKEIFFAEIWTYSLRKYENIRCGRKYSLWKYLFFAGIYIHCRFFSPPCWSNQCCWTKPGIVGNRGKNIENNVWLLWITVFGHECGDSPIIFSSDAVTSENHRQSPHEWPKYRYSQ